MERSSLIELEGEKTNKNQKTTSIEKINENLLFLLNIYYFSHAKHIRSESILT